MSRRRDRWIGGVVGALVMLVLVVVAGAVAVWSLTEPAGGAGPTARPPAPDRPSEAAPVPDDLASGETWLGDLVLDSATLVTTDATLRDVEAIGDGVRTGPSGTVVRVLEVDATVPFDAVAAELGPGTVVRPGTGGEAEVVREVELAGRVLRVVASGTVEVVDGRLVVEPTAVDVGGPSFLAEGIAGVVRGLVTISQPVEGLPDGLELLDVEVVDDGFRASLAGEDVVLTPAG